MGVSWDYPEVRYSIDTDKGNTNTNINTNILPCWIFILQTNVGPKVKVVKHTPIYSDCLAAVAVQTCVPLSEKPAITTGRLGKYHLCIR